MEPIFDNRDEEKERLERRLQRIERMRREKQRQEEKRRMIKRLFPFGTGADRKSVV